MSEPMPTIPTQSPFTYSNPNPSASPSFTQDDTSESFNTYPNTTYQQFHQTAFSQPAFLQPNQSIFSQPAVHFQQTQPTQTKQQGNSPKRLGKDAKGNTIVHPPVSLDEHVAVQRRIRLGFGGNEESKKIMKPCATHLQILYDKEEVALALKTRGGLESMSFDDLYNKLRSLELDVRIGHSYGVKVAAAPTHSAFIGTTSSGSKPTYSDQQHIVPSVSQTSGRSDNLMECVLHSFVAENELDQDMIYEDFDQVDQLEMEEMDLKWQMAMLSLRINRFEKKAGRKMNYNNQQPARFDRRKVRCYKCLQLGHFARECNVKTVDDKARYSAFKVTEVKTDEPKALVSVDSMVNWSDHAAENKTGEVEKVYGMMAGLHADNGGAGISNAADEFAMMGISPKAYQNAVKTLESQKDWPELNDDALICCNAPTGSREGESSLPLKSEQIFCETLTGSKKFRAAQRAAEIRSKPPTKTQLRNLMMTYLKNTGGYKSMSCMKDSKRGIKILNQWIQRKKFRSQQCYEKEKEELRLSLKILYGVDSEVYYEPTYHKISTCKMVIISGWKLVKKTCMFTINQSWLVSGKVSRDHLFEGHDLLLWGRSERCYLTQMKKMKPWDESTGIGKLLEIWTIA
ncbi:ribonuclease H-like domain-containing protein [Tanacetum coccineum]|uniref:Ribonuclease H-like domain-containing protein n=1 Tax=Tanacetum coccineum TaxID=301880 RepID=A0ABQ5J805_9ASTR